MLSDTARKSIRIDLQLMADMIEPDTRVLDVGCAEGELLDYLVNTKGIDARGIELSTDGVNSCVSAGLPVIQGDAETDLVDYPDQAFDYVILSRTLQAMKSPKDALNQLLRIGKRAIVSFPNFGHWRVRWQLFAKGRMPVNETLAYEWYDTPNIHFCTIKDFIVLCDELGITIERSIALDHQGNIHRIRSQLFAANLFGEQGVFLLSRR